MFSFFCFGHKNILSTHKKTIEFTKDRDLSLNGNCIVGVKADFDAKELRDFIQTSENIRIMLKLDNMTEVINARANKKFNHDSEIVIRISDFISDRTLAIRADKSSADISRNFINSIKNEDIRFQVIIKEV